MNIYNNNNNKKKSMCNFDIYLLIDLSIVYNKVLYPRLSFLKNTGRRYDCKIYARYNIIYIIRSTAACRQVYTYIQLVGVIDRRQLNRWISAHHQRFILALIISYILSQKYKYKRVQTHGVGVSVCRCVGVQCKLFFNNPILLLI